MRVYILLLILLISISSIAQDGPIAVIDLYGLKKIKPETILKQIPVKIGDSISKIDKQALEKKLQSIPGIKQSHIATVCCTGNNGWMVYIGISEDSIHSSTYNPEPKENVTLPQEMMNAYNEFMKLIYEAVVNNQGNQTDSAGFAFMTYPPAKQVQEKMMSYARSDQPHLREVLYRSNDESHRAAAAWMIAYASNKVDLNNDLLHAVNDPNEEVRNNATRALGTLAGYANKHPELNLNIPAEPFIAMINSIVWTDRNKGSFVLLTLTEKPDRYLFRLLKEKALSSLADMARWKEPGHAEISYVILARMAGVDENKKELTVDELLKKINATKY